MSDNQAPAYTPVQSAGNTLPFTDLHAAQQNGTVTQIWQQDHQLFLGGTRNTNGIITLYFGFADAQHSITWWPLDSFDPNALGVPPIRHCSITIGNLSSAAERLIQVDATLHYAWQYPALTLSGDVRLRWELNNSTIAIVGRHDDNGKLHINERSISWIYAVELEAEANAAQNDLVTVKMFGSYMSTPPSIGENNLGAVDLAAAGTMPVCLVSAPGDWSGCRVAQVDATLRFEKLSALNIRIDGDVRTRWVVGDVTLTIGPEEGDTAPA